VPSDLGLHAIQEAIRQAGYGGVLPFLPLLLLGTGAVLIYLGVASLLQEQSALSELPLPVRIYLRRESTTGATFIIVGGWLFYLAYACSR